MVDWRLPDWWTQHPELNEDQQAECKRLFDNWNDDLVIQRTTYTKNLREIDRGKRNTQDWKERSQQETYRHIQALTKITKDYLMDVKRYLEDTGYDKIIS